MTKRSSFVEQNLGVKLPSDYADFLNEYGIVEIDGLEIFGYCDCIQDIEKIPCVIGATRLYRPLYDLEDHLIVLGATGYEEILFVLDTQNGKVYETGFDWRHQIADSFDQWLQSLKGEKPVS
jgi:hypothetical protein